MIFYQITLNTGDIAKFSDKDVDERLHFILSRIFKDSQGPDGAEFELGHYKYRVKTTLSGDKSGLTTLFGYNPEGKMIPILTTGFSLYSYDILDFLINDETYVGKLDLSKIKERPKTPYIADRLEAGAAVLFYQGVTQWSGDYSKCLGLTALNAIK